MIKDNDINNDSQNEPLNNSQNNLYPSMSRPMDNTQVIEVNRHQDLIYYLRQIANNTSEYRIRQQNGDSVSFVVLFFVFLFLVYMGISFYRAGGFETLVGRS